MSRSLDGKLLKECGEILVPPVLDLSGAESRELLLVYEVDDSVDEDSGVPSWWWSTFEFPAADFTNEVLI